MITLVSAVVEPGTAGKATTGKSDASVAATLGTFSRRTSWRAGNTRTGSTRTSRDSTQISAGGSRVRV